MLFPGLISASQVPATPGPHSLPQPPAPPDPPPYPNLLSPACALPRAPLWPPPRSSLCPPPRSSLSSPQGPAVPSSPGPCCALLVGLACALLLGPACALLLGPACPLQPSRSAPCPLPAGPPLWLLQPHDVATDISTVRYAASSAQAGSLSPVTTEQGPAPGSSCRAVCLGSDDTLSCLNPAHGPRPPRVTHLPRPLGLGTSLPNTLYLHSLLLKIAQVLKKADRQGPGLWLGGLSCHLQRQHPL